MNHKEEETPNAEVPILEPGWEEGIYFVKVNNCTLNDITPEQMYALMALFRHELDNLYFKKYQEDLERKKQES